MSLSAKLAASLRRWYARLPWPLNELTVFLLLGLAAALAIGAIMFVLMGIGAVSAVGFEAAWALNRPRLAAALPRLVLTGLGFGASSFCVLQGNKWLDRQSQSGEGRGLLILIVVTALVSLTLFVRSERRNTLQDYERLTAGDGGQPDAGRLVDSQARAMSALTGSVRSLLTGLETTERELGSSRRQLEQTLAALTAHDRATTASQSSLKDVQERQELIRVQIGRLQEALGGQQPITRADLDKSQWYGTLQGVLLGLFATEGFRWVKRRWLRARRPTPSDDTTAPPDNP